MKSTTIASEQTNPYYVKLKTSPTPDWYIQAFDQNKRKFDKQHLSKQERKQPFMIDRIGFFRKHAWVHFQGEEKDGWLPFKSVRNNFRMLKVPTIKQSKIDTKHSYFTAVQMMLNYDVSDEQSLSILTPLFKSNTLDLTPTTFMNVILNSIGSFRNLSNKSLRGIRNQLLRQRPVVIWGSPNYRPYSAAIVLVGFNKRLFFYNDPISGQRLTITKKQLMKYWRWGNYQALSY